MNELDRFAGSSIMTDVTTFLQLSFSQARVKVHKSVDVALSLLNLEALKRGQEANRAILEEATMERNVLSIKKGVSGLVTKGAVGVAVGVRLAEMGNRIVSAVESSGVTKVIAPLKSGFGTVVDGVSMLSDVVTATSSKMYGIAGAMGEKLGVERIINDEEVLEVYPEEEKMAPFEFVSKDVVLMSRVGYQRNIIGLDEQDATKPKQQLFSDVVSGVEEKAIGCMCNYEGRVMHLYNCCSENSLVKKATGCCKKNIRTSIEKSVAKEVGKACCTEATQICAGLYGILSQISKSVFGC